jgi:mercuric ion transport protein
MMTNKLLKTGINGTIDTSICCFTPFLVWPLSVAGLAPLVGYLDSLLLPLLALFVVMLIVGLVVAIKNKNKDL